MYDSARDKAEAERLGAAVQAAAEECVRIAEQEMRHWSIGTGARLACMTVVHAIRKAFGVKRT